MDHADDTTVELTSREREVIALVADGQTTKQVARTLALSPRTVEAHVVNCRRKLGARNNSQLVARAIADGFVVR